MPRPRLQQGFTLVEVLIAMAITAFVATVAYTGLSTVMTGMESTRENAQRSYEVSRAWMIITRDLRQFTNRPVRDEFGELEPALQGGPVARFALSLTRGGWHNPNALLRSNLQRVNYRVEDNALWRDSYPVLDRAGDTEPASVILLSDVDDLRLLFLGSVDTAGGTGINLDTRQWPDNWVVDTSQPGATLAPPAALQVTLQLADWGEMTRLYVLPSR
jgi:general secretion pathway protein J